ncbi:MotA/TolQ/ExbB proton channel family protein [Posidoniimonas corsicana]|uniref:MotA/TolQ/ExbB proton channel family protein n=1 Tax=Posidoniimonas corsicana TaxID=1938618 RepID=A0A5C5VCM1_9BACT|nr:MotA/TolQ/ExbB proton channel family protein [Posidoniimonas corsicana]TWT35589.1 MotA/TolQ/ExbB proton channel family protein [Posidoniimonas corsicana]
MATTMHSEAPAADIDPERILSWTRLDVEQRLGFRGARFTRVSTPLTFLIGLAITVVFYAAITLADDTYFSQMFCDRGIIPYAIVSLTGWSLAILYIKYCKLRVQRRALEVPVAPTDHEFVLSPATVNDVLTSIYRRVDDPQRFIVFNRVLLSLANLKNLGRVTDVDEMLRSQAEYDESVMETSYSLLRGFVWAIPVLGFIGTVLGLSAAIGSFGSVLSENSDMSVVAQSLRGVTSGLATAFETTLEALVAALVIQILVTFLRKSEEEFLDDAREYCHQQVVNRLRMTPFESTTQ